MRRKKSKGKVEWVDAPDVHTALHDLVTKLKFDWIDLETLHSFRSYNSSARAYARIWGLNKVWQLAIKHKPSYIIEVLAENYDKLSDKEKAKVLLHEIAHIPKNYSGSLLPHTRRKGKRNFHDRVEDLFAQYIKFEKGTNPKPETMFERAKDLVSEKLNIKKLNF